MRPDPDDRWKIRRLLIVSAVLFSAVMIIAGGIGLYLDKFSGELVYGGVTIISAVLAAYQTMATLDDRWQNNKDSVPLSEDEKGTNPDG